MTQTQDQLKQEIRKFWGTRPCGIVSSKQPVSSHAFFTETARHRFQIHTDWDRAFLKDAVRFQEHKNKRVLEIGCGIGVDGLEWARAGNRYVGLDYNFPSCQITRSRFEDDRRSGAFSNGDAENLPFSDNSFDLVYSFGVLHHTPATEKAIDEVYRCLRPGGEAIIMLYYKWSALVFGDVLLGRGLWQGALWKARSIGQLISNYTEWDSQTESNINPLTRVFSKRQAHKMFRRFRNVEMELHYLWPGHFGPLRRLALLLPDSLKHSLHRWVGWNLMIRAVK
ncbi:MAG: class I SAM-dependent methyltransferase [Acidobacteriia bacterium]|nr:class I SAM-dependent methyltransferase [Terriglobia bacterium]